MRLCPTDDRGNELQRRAKISGKSSDYPLVVLFPCNHNAGRIVRMGCGDAGPNLPGRRYEDWNLDDPAGKDAAQVRLIRDEIERGVHRLLDELRIPCRP